MIAGVIAGLGRRLNVDPVPLRVAFAALVIVSGGLALAGYAIAWALLPSDHARARREATQPPEDEGRRRRFPKGSSVAAGVALLTLSGLLVFRELGIWWSDALVWPLVLAAAGATLLWRQLRSGEPEEPSSPKPRPAANPQTGVETAPTPGSRLADLYRGGFGVALVVGAALLFLSANDALGPARDAAFTTIVVVLALGLVLAPFLWRLGRNLASERAERIRSQERAEVAAHLHDSVLQTLALVQKRADDSREVATLARRQERELRGWLSGDTRSPNDSLAAALQQAADEVEAQYGVPIEVVAVGDRDHDDRTRALVAAAREALTNAAKFAPDSGPVSVYAEVDGFRVQVFVRDRGDGFDPAGVPADRRGISESIIGRMQRNGGKATIRSDDGGGTEIELVLEAPK